MTDDPRLRELAENLAALQMRVGRACDLAGREVSSITVIAVTKTWPVEDIVRLLSLGVTDVGENRHQEGIVKRGRLRESAAAMAVDLAGAPRWHHIGRVQRNKARALASWADVVHGLDREELLQPLLVGDRVPDVLVQISLDGDPTRGGCAPSQAPALALEAQRQGLRVRGVMAVAPLGADPALAYGRLAGVAAEIRGAVPGAEWISAGMSGDFESAVAAGATHLRIGTVLLGGRNLAPG